MHNLSIALFTRKEIIKSRAAVSAIGVTVFVLLTLIGAHVYIPLGFTPVPITLQTLFVFLSGAVLGRKLGAISQITYIMLGASGMPFFVAGGFGTLYLLGPTGGYIFGFVAASYIIGRILKEKDSSILVIVAALAAGALAVFISGTFWLVLGLGLDIKQALLLGVIPFIPGCIIKIAIAAVITKSCLKRTRQIFS
jgi:biotin transport system substrate-specific component